MSETGEGSRMVASKKIRHQLWRQVGNLLSDDRGQSTTEYILILAVVVMIAMKFKGIMQSNMSSMLGTLNTNLNAAVQDTSGQSP